MFLVNIILALLECITYSYNCNIQSLTMLIDVVRFTARVSELMDVLKDLNRGAYQRTLINSRRTADDDEKRGMVVEYVQQTIVETN